MATVLELAEQGILVKYDPHLAPTVQELRQIFVTPNVRDWLTQQLPTMNSSWNLEASPLEQFDALAEEFCAGKVLKIDWQLKSLNHLGDGIWELKTADVRLFGWFPARDCFIAADADTAERVKTHNLYRGYSGQVARKRDQLALNEPKFVPGDNPNGVVSNYAYPD